MQQSSENKMPFSLPHDSPSLTQVDYLDYETGIDNQIGYDEGMDDTIDVNLYEYNDDDPIRSAKKAMQRGIGTVERVTIKKAAIKNWAKNRGGHPAHIKGVTDGWDRGGLYIRFDGTEPDFDIEPITWRQFFEIFTINQLTFLYRTKTRTGNMSKFYMLIHQPRAYY